MQNPSSILTTEFTIYAMIILVLYFYLAFVTVKLKEIMENEILMRNVVW